MWNLRFRVKPLCSDIRKIIIIPLGQRKSDIIGNILVTKKDGEAPFLTDKETRDQGRSSAVKAHMTAGRDPMHPWRHPCEWPGNTGANWLKCGQEECRASVTGDVSEWRPER